jgi:hypothetical protein
MKGCAMLTLLRGNSQKNSYAQAVMSTYLAATGGQRQHYSVLSLYGFLMGYSSTISTPNLVVVLQCGQHQLHATLHFIQQ